MDIKISNSHQISILYLTVFDANTANTRLKYKYKYATFKILKYKYQFLCICKYKYVFDHIPGNMYLSEAPKCMAIVALLGLNP